MGYTSGEFTIEDCGAVNADTSSKVTIKDLPYEMSGLEPIVSGHLMEYHYGKHHKTYVKNLNALTEKA
jgi:superoxide dismutase